MIKVMHIITTLGPAGAENMLCRIASRMDGTQFESEIVSLTGVLDLAESQGTGLADALTGKPYLDFFTFFATAPLGINPPQLVHDGDFMSRLAAIAWNWPARAGWTAAACASFRQPSCAANPSSSLPSPAGSSALSVPHQFA